MNRLLTLPARVLIVVIARVIGAEMVYSKAACDSMVAAIHHHRTQEVNDGQRVAS